MRSRLRRRLTATLGLVAATAVGVAAGFVVSGVDPVPRAPQPAEPAAASPAAPVVTSPEPLPDPTDPPLPTDVPLVEQQLGSGLTALDVPVPAAWRRADKFANEAQWHVPGSPRYTYFLRLEQVSSQHRSPRELAATRVEDLALESPTVNLVGRSADSVEFTYHLDGRERHVVMRWVSLARRGPAGLDPLGLGPSADADLEIAVTGRERDVPGMRRLAEEIATGVVD